MASNYEGIMAVGSDTMAPQSLGHWTFRFSINTTWGLGGTIGDKGGGVGRLT